MATNFPTSLDSLTNPTASDKLNSVTVPHASQHADINDAVEALEAKVGVDGSAVTSSLDYKMSKQSVVPYDDASARTAAVPSPVEGEVSYLKDTNTVEVYNGSSWVVTGNAGVASYRYVQTVYFTSTGTFTKASYPWLKAIRVTCQAGGGGGGGSDYCDAGDGAAAVGGGGGCYAESFITDIGSLAASVTVTVGSGGAGGTGGTSGTPTATAGVDGGDSSFGLGTAYEVDARGGRGGLRGPDTPELNFPQGASARREGTGDLLIGAEATSYSSSVGLTDSATAMASASNGGSSVIGSGGVGGRVRAGNQSESGSNGSAFGGGGGGAATCAETVDTDGEAGGNGSSGIVIVELYA